jgi:hypothetical protein
MTDVFRVGDPEDYRRAALDDLVELHPAPHTNPLILPKRVLEALAYGIATSQCIHVSAGTGAGKTALIVALAQPENFAPICDALGLPVRPVRLFPIQTHTFETPGEFFFRRALHAEGGGTYDEDSQLVRALFEANDVKATAYSVIWLREIGRVHTASVQGGLLDLITPSEIILHDGRSIGADHIAWIADSNYQAETEATHTLVTLDDALRRRLTINVCPSLTGEQEAIVLRRLAPATVSDDRVSQVVRLGLEIRMRKSEGGLQSITPPTIAGYLGLLKMGAALTHFTIEELAKVTLLGGATSEDAEELPDLYQTVFGLKIPSESSAMGGALF